MKLRVAAALTVLALVAPQGASSHGPSLELRPIGTYASGIFAEGGAEIVTYDPKTRRAFVVNALDVSVDVLDLSDARHPVKLDTIMVGPLGGGSANSVATRHGILAVAVEAEEKTDPGFVAFYSTHTLGFLCKVAVGALPDMLTFNDDGNKVLVANEGEPSGYGLGTVDPEGSVSIIDIGHGCHGASVRTADFRRFNSEKEELIEAGVRIYGPGASVAQDLEPEYIAVKGDTAWVTLQEANALAIVDIDRARVNKIVPLGLKDHSRRRNGLDASDDDDAINIARWPVLGMYQPDGIAAYEHKGETYLVTANEGDARDWDGLAEEVRVGEEDDDDNPLYVLDPAVFPSAETLRDDAALGRLTVTNQTGDTDGDGDFDEIHVLGGRSFSIWDARGRQVFDSGDQIEKITARLLPEHFNSNHEENDSFDNRSDNKGPEPEGVALGEIDDRTYAFVGLERIGGVMVFDVTSPWKVEFVTYVNNRNFDVAFDGDDDDDWKAAGDLGPEGLHFVPSRHSPTRKPLLLVGNEISGTTTVYEIRGGH
jgi:hypothetical protein